MHYLRLLLFISFLVAYSATAQKSPADYVNPFVGTDFNGHTFPGATTPFGMVQLSPDTRIDGSWEGCSGYHYSDNRIYGFSHTHLSGTGVSDYGDILIMPQVGNGYFNPETYSATFKHENEWASPGYYSVKLDNGLVAELSTTARVGFHKYTFPEDQFSVVIDLEHRDLLVEGAITVIDEKTISIKRVSSAWAKEQHCYGYVLFSRPFKHRYNSTKTKIILEFNSNERELKIKSGISFVSEVGAKKNLEKELAHWNFQQCRDEAKQSWNNALCKIEVNDDNIEKLKTFYTALYHVMIHPNVAMDVDRQYRGLDQKIHTAKDFTYYTIFSLWDTFRATHPLFTIIESERTLDFIKTFLTMYQEGGRLPVWELCANETDCMIGYHSVSVIADAMAKGITDFDQELAYEAMTTSANWNHLGLPEYINQGFLSIDDEHESVSKTLEYAYDDWCIAQTALRLGKMEEYNEYMLRSNAWRNLLDPSSNLMRPRMNGGWLSPFDPREVNNHFTEGNSWQYSFFVPQDIEGMIQAMGGNDSFEKMLDALFTAPVETTGRTQPDISGLIGQYAHGNEPSHHMAYLYNYVNKPEKCKARVHQILSEFYSSKPDGLIGNEDCGQMSAWYVMSALGIYSVTPGQSGYELVVPFLNSYTVHLENGNTFSDETIKRILKKRPFISHFELTNSDMPPKIPISELGQYYLKPPIISSSTVSFDDSLKVDISSTQGSQVFYKFASKEQEFRTNPFYIYESEEITAYSRIIGPEKTHESKKVKARFYKNPHPSWSVNLHSEYNPQYSAGGDIGLIDGIHGDKNWRKGYWQGFQNQDFEVIIDMDSSQIVSSVEASFLQDTRSWIVFPTQVHFYGSADGLSFNKIGIVENAVPAKDYETQIKAFNTSLETPIKLKKIKVIANNYGTLPEWHQGKGGKAFIFVDEINVN